MSCYTDDTATDGARRNRLQPTRRRQVLIHQDGSGGWVVARQGTK